MLKKIDHTLLGTAYHTRLQSIFHFSMADYYKPGRTHFGCLKVINDDLIHVGSGHDLHKHKEVDILCYVVDGTLTHAVKGDGVKTLVEGDMYYMMAGQGIEHAEVNWGETSVRLLQLWFSPAKKNKEPGVAYATFNNVHDRNKWVCLGSRVTTSAIFEMNQAVEVFICELEVKQDIEFNVKKDEQAYLVQIKGQARINDVELAEKDGLEIYEEKIRLIALRPSLFIIVVMDKEHI
ncbi:MAG TPA: pirin family protein [Firmicutes bacterium]|nr:pirin family protein [Bacillota bacterium]